MDRKFRIGYFADGPWSHRAFELLVDDASIEIAFIVPRIDTKDQTLKNYAQKYQIDYLFPEKINSSFFYEKAVAYDCDLFVSMSFNQIFKRTIFELPRISTINCHAGKLPFYRGRNILNWVLINDEKEFGITVHHIDDGIDTGDIILQKTYPISDEDNYNTLLNRAYDGCASILYQAIKLIQKDNAPRIPQNLIHPVGFYCGKRTFGDEIINWNQTSREIFNFIRAICSPGPIARTMSKKEEIKINAARLIEGAPVYKNKPGQVLARTTNGYLVKTGDSFLEILEIESKLNLKPGDRLI